MKDFSNNYWEDYYGQSVAEFTKLSYVQRNGERVFVDIEENIDAQIAEIKRVVGNNTELRLYKDA